MNGLYIKYDANLSCFQNQMRVCTTKVLVADKMNFEVQSQYTLTSHVITEDAGKKTVETCTLTVLDVNEAPTVSSQRFSFFKKFMLKCVESILTCPKVVNDSIKCDFKPFYF